MRQAYYSGDTLLSPHCWWGLGEKSRVDKQSVSSPRYSGQPMATSHQRTAAPEFEPSFSDSKTQYLMELEEAGLLCIRKPCL